MTEQEARVFTLDNRDRVVAVKDGRRWQPTYQEHCHVVATVKDGVYSRPGLSAN